MAVELFGRVLPRHLEIIYEINERFLDGVRGRRAKADDGAVSRMSLIEEGTPKQVRMANLAVVGSHSVNGVAALHTDLLRARAVPRLPPALARALQQQDQRRHPAALAAPGQPGLATSSSPR